MDKDEAINWSASDLTNKMTNQIKAYLTCETVQPGVLCDVPSLIETERGAMLDDVRHHLMAAMVGECPPEGRVYRTIAPLNAQRRLVLRLRFGLDGEKPLTLEQAGRRLGVTRERIRQIEERALELLQANDDLRGLFGDGKGRNKGIRTVVVGGNYFLQVSDIVIPSNTLRQHN